MELILIFIWFTLLILIIAFGLIYLFHNHKSHKNLNDIYEEHHQGIEKNQYLKNNISTLRDPDLLEEDPIMDLLPPNALIPIPEEPTIPSLPENVKLSLQSPNIPLIPEQIAIEVPHPPIEKPKLATTKDDSKNAVIKQEESKPINYVLQKEEYDSNKLQYYRNVKQINNEGLQKTVSEPKNEINFGYFTYFIGLPIILILYFLFYTLHIDLNLYFLVVSIYFLILAFIFYRKSGKFAKAPNQYAVKVIDQTMIKKSQIFLGVAYIVEFVGIFLESIISRNSDLSFILFFAILGISGYSIYYGFKKKNKYIVLLGIYILGVEIVAKLYDIVSQVFPDLPFWSYILIGGVIILDLTIIILNKWEKKEDKRVQKSDLSQF